MYFFGCGSLSKNIYIDAYHLKMFNKTPSLKICYQNTIFIKNKYTDS